MKFRTRSKIQSLPETPQIHQGYLPQLDAVRGLACLMVLVAHMKAVRGLHWLDDRIGTAGVGLFFALSGFLITRILIADKSSGRGLNAFYNRRAARIFPIYFLMLLVLWFVWPGKEIGWASTFTFNLHYLTGVREYFHIDAGTESIPPVAHVWSLCVEEHYYWLWPALVWLLPARIYRWLPLLCIAATPAVTYFVLCQLRARGFQQDTIEGLISRLTLTQVVAVSFGSCVAIFERSLARPVRLSHVVSSRLLILGVSSLLISVASWLAISAWVTKATDRMLWEPTLLHLGCGGLLALGLCCPRLGRIRALNGIGRISYGLYLFHLPIYAALGLAQSVTAVPHWRGAAALLATFAFAAASFRLIEAPILAWIRRKQNDIVPRVNRMPLSVGSIITLFLATVLVYQAVVWFRNHPEIPKELRFANLGPSGFMVMGVFHELDSEGFRRNTPFPPKKAAVPRVATVGDSYTYGQCVENDKVLASVAERLLRARGIEVEVLNLGKRGTQAEDMVRTIEKTALPILSNAIIYCASVDDFKASGNHDPYPLKGILTDPVFTERFREAIRAMHGACKAKGVIFQVMPFTQYPDDSENISLVRLIQTLCKEENVPLIDIELYLRDNNHRNFAFNKLDSHPNAECHGLHAEILVKELMRLHESGELRSK